MENERKVIRGIPLSPGRVMGRAKIYHPDHFYEAHINETYINETSSEANVKIAGYPEEEPDMSQVPDVFHKAIALALEELEANVIESGPASSASQGMAAEIFAAHQTILKDEELIGEIERAILQGETVAEAVDRIFTAHAQKLSACGDALIAERAEDLCDVKCRLRRILNGENEKKSFAMEGAGIVVAEKLLPSEMVTMDRSRVRGIFLARCSANGHTAILARSMGIPVVSGPAEAEQGIAKAEWAIAEGTLLLLDGTTGEVIMHPTKEEVDHLLAEEKEDLESGVSGTDVRMGCTKTPYIMADGTRIRIGIHIGDADFDLPKESYDFIGLFRTEFLYMGRDALPTEEEQVAIYRKALENACGHRLTLRTLDAGGDKEISALGTSEETRSPLGLRGLRSSLVQKEVFRTQLRAALRASAYGPMRLLFPMVTNLEDICQAKACVESAKEELRQEGHLFDEDIPLGVMIEVPSLALLADQVAEEVDFASIGTNDLTQYVCAADRGSVAVSNYYEEDSPAVLRLISEVLDAFGRHGKEVSVCGEMAGNPKMAAKLVEMGVRYLGMDPHSIGEVVKGVKQRR